LQQRLGEQRIDIILTAAKPDEQQPTQQIAKETGILLLLNLFNKIKRLLRSLFR